MKRTALKSIRLWLAAPMVLGAMTALAGESWAPLTEPPTAVVPPGEILRAGHLGREIGQEDPIIHFYSDLLGFNLIGPREATHKFVAVHGLQEFAELGEGDANAYDSVSRVALMPIPGTAVAGGTAMTIEAIEIKGIKAGHYNPPLNDPGASYLKVIVTDIDKTLAVLEGERFEVITDGGEPVELASWPGLSGKIRAVYVRDPDGYPVELLQLTPAPSSTAPADSKVLGARVTVVVDDLEASVKFYQGLVGSELKFWASGWMGDKVYENLTHTRGQFRMAVAMVPGSPVALELMEYKQHDKHFQRGYIQEPGTAHFLFMVKDTDAVIPRMKQIHAHTLSKSNAPVFIGPTTRSFFVPDPQGFWLEFMDREVKTQPAAH